jgi:hypothetical protein
MKKQTALIVFVLSLIALLLMNYDSGYSFTVSHSYEIGSIRKPRQMHWKTYNWEMIAPLAISLLSASYLIFSRKRN